MDDSALDGYESDGSLNDQEREELNELIDEMFESSDSEDEDFEGFVFHFVQWIRTPRTAMLRPIPLEEYAEEGRNPGYLWMRACLPSNFLTLLVLGDCLLTLYWGGGWRFWPPLFFSDSTGDIAIRLTTIVL